MRMDPGQSFQTITEALLSERTRTGKPNLKMVESGSKHRVDVDVYDSMALHKRSFERKSESTVYAGLNDEMLHRLASQHGLAEHEIMELMLAFSVLDVDGSGAISVSELMEVVGYAQPSDHG